MVESGGVAEDSGIKAEEAEEVESSDGKDPETSNGVGGADQWLGIWSVLPTWLSCIRGKTTIVSDGVVLTIL